jgi:DNA-binding response OmpR family regulator
LRRGGPCGRGAKVDVVEGGRPGAGTEESTRMSKRLLILIDSEPVTSRTLALDLSEAGYVVDTAEDDHEAIEKIRSVPFDLLIATEGPERGSVEASGMVARMRRIRPAAKVVLMTTDSERVEASGGDASAGGGVPAVPEGGAGDAGSVVRVRKPFDLEEFRSVVERLLERRASGSAQ